MILIWITIPNTIDRQSQIVWGNNARDWDRFLRMLDANPTPFNLIKGLFIVLRVTLCSSVKRSKW
jgi:hypothetical protein